MYLVAGGERKALATGPQALVVYSAIKNKELGAQPRPSYVWRQVTKIAQSRTRLGANSSSGDSGELAASSLGDFMLGALSTGTIGADAIFSIQYGSWEYYS